MSIGFYKGIILSFFLLFTSVLAIGQTTVQIGSATTAVRENPVNRQSNTGTNPPNPANYSVSQYIWTKAEINGNAGGTGVSASPSWNAPGCIDRIAFFKNDQTSTTATCANVQIWMRNDPASTLSTGSWSTAGYTLVFSGTFNHGSNTQTGWRNIDLQTPFLYDNVNNLHVIVTNSSGTTLGNGGAAPSFRMTNLNSITSDVRCRFFWDPNALPTFISASGNRANVQLRFNTAPSGNPPTSITGTTTICSGSSTTLTAQGGSATTRWFTGSCGGTLVGTGASITVSPTSNTTYFAANTQGCAGTSITSCVQTTVTVNPTPTAPSALTFSPNPVCPNTQVTLSGNNTGANTQWYSGGTCGGSVIGSGASTNVSPSTTTTYSARNVVNGCNSSCASVSVTVTQPPAQPSVINGQTNVCTGSQNYSVTNVAGTTYTWSVSGGGAVSGTGNSISINWTQAGTHTISVTATNACGTSNARTLQVTVTSGVPNQPGAITGSTSLCAGATTYSIASVSGATGYTWTVSGGGTIQSGQGTTSISVNWTTAGGPYTVSVVATNVCGNSTPATTQVTVQPGTPAQPSAISGQTNVCAGNQNYSVINVAGVTYNWSVSGGGTVSGSGNTISINWTQQGTHTISVTASNTCGTSTTRTLQVTVTAAAPNQPGAITGTTTPCAGQQNYSVPNVSGVTYNWTLSGGGSISTGQGTNAITINWTTVGGPYTLSVVANNTCGNSSAQTIQVNVQPGAPNQPGVITGANDICISNQAYSIQPVNGATGYTWSVSGGGSIASGQGSTNVNINWISGGNYTVSVVAIGTCGNSAPSTYNVTVTPNAPSGNGSITGAATVCPGNQTYTVSGLNNATGYTWAVPLPGTITSGQNTPTITVNWGATSGTFPVSVVAENVCGSATPVTLNVTVVGGAPATPTAITGNTNPCPGNQTYTIQPVADATNYVWTLNNGGTITAGQGSTSITVDWTTTGGPYTISVIAENICGNSSAAQLQVNVQNGTPLVPGNITGNDVVCPQNENYSIPAVVGADTYTWTLSGGVTIVSGQGTNQITVNWAQAGGYTVSVVASNSCSSSSPVTLAVTVDNAVPATPGNITGTASSCGSVSEIYTIASVPNATNYVWTLSGGGTIVNGQGTTQITVDWASVPGNYTLSVIAENSCGSSNAATTIVNILEGAPATPGPIFGSLEACAGNIATYSVTPVSGATVYTWAVTSGNTILSGQGTSQISVQLNTAPGTYTLSVSASNSCGSSSVFTAAITVNPSPTLPSVSVSNDTICPGETITISASNSTGGTIAYSFYDEAIGGTFLGVSPLSVAPLTTTTYYLEVSNEFGCRFGNSRLPVTIVVNTPASGLVISAENDSVCFNATTTLNATATPSSATITWWNSATGGTLLATGNSFVTGNLTSTTIFYAQATTIEGCNNAAGRVPFEVFVNASPDVTLTSDKDNNTIFFNEVITFTALPGGYDNYEFFVNGISVQSGIENEYATSRFKNNDTIRVIATNNGCAGKEAEAVVKVTDFPNAFTPNNDGRNDVFLKGFDLVILNRWGQELYRGVDGWDGTYRGSKVAPGTYFYILTLKNITDNENIVKGTVLVVKD